MKTKIIAILVVVSLASLVYLFFRTRSHPTSISHSFKNLQVGTDTKNDVLSKMGSPLSSSLSSSDREKLDYSSQNQYWPHQVYIQTQNQKATLVKERLLHTVLGELKNYIDKYGPPEAVLASNDDLPALGFRLHVSI